MSRRSVLLALWVAAAVGGAARAGERSGGLQADEAIFKWSAPTLAGGEWIAGVEVVAHGLTDRTTLWAEPSSAVLGYYGGRLRHDAGELLGGVGSVEVGAGLWTPVALARLAVPQWPSRPVVAMVDVAGMVTRQPSSGRFITYGAWGSLAVGRVSGTDDEVVTLLGRSGLSGLGGRVGFEDHLTRRVGLVARQDLGFDLSGGYRRFVARTTGALLFGAGPIRVNLGATLVTTVPVGARVSLHAGLVPALDVWARW